MSLSIYSFNSLLQGSATPGLWSLHGCGPFRTRLWKWQASARIHAAPLERAAPFAWEVGLRTRHLHKWSFTLMWSCVCVCTHPPLALNYPLSPHPPVRKTGKVGDRWSISFLTSRDTVAPKLWALYKICGWNSFLIFMFKKDEERNIQKCNANDEWLLHNKHYVSVSIIIPRYHYLLKWNESRRRHFFYCNMFYSSKLYPS